MILAENPFVDLDRPPKKRLGLDVSGEIMLRREKRDRPTPNKLALRRAQPHHHSVWFVGGGCLAVRNIFLLCFQQGGRRLVFTVRLGNVFGRSGGHLQARPFLSERTGNGAQRRTRIGAERNRASPQPAQILCSPFVLRLSDRHRRYRGLGLRGRTAPTDFSVNGNSCPIVTCIIVTSLSRPQAWCEPATSMATRNVRVTSAYPAIATKPQTSRQRWCEYRYRSGGDRDRCPLWVISGQTIPSQSWALSALVQ